jgi:hypothetical protein
MGVKWKVRRGWRPSEARTLGELAVAHRDRVGDSCARSEST